MRGLRPEESSAEVLSLLELDSENRIATRVGFDVDDIDAALVELETRYLAGEAAEFAQTWSVITQGYAAANRGRLAFTAPNVVNIDHRRLPMINSNELIPYLRNTFDELADINTYLEAVHRLTPTGAVVTHVGAGTSREGFEAEWRMINVLAVKGDAIIRSELFDETDLDVALTRFDELNRSTQRPENSASRTADRFCECFGARDWIGMAGTLADNVCTEDTRPVVGVGKRQGPQLNVSDWQAVAEVGTRNLTSTVIATRGERLVLSRFRTSGRDQRPEAFYTEVLCVIEINADNRIAACVMFDRDELDAAFQELDAQYLAGEAARHTEVWSDVADAYAMFNRHEIPAVSNWVTIDHRVRETFAARDLAAYIRSGWDVTPDNKMYVECVHRLSDRGAVVTHVAYGRSPEGLYAEWRMIALVTIDSASTNYCELFEEADLETALAKFDNLGASTSRLGNAALRAWTQVADAFNRRDVEAVLLLLSDDGCQEDRRSGLRSTFKGPERRRAVQAMFAAPASWRVEIEPIAIRGSLLSLTRERYRDTASDDGQVVVELLTVFEMRDDAVVDDTVDFDPDDLADALRELESRYIADEAAAYSHTWSVITQAYAAFNRREVPRTTPVWVDHRLLATIEADDLIANVRAAWDIAPDVMVHIASVHRLDEAGAVVEQVVRGSSLEGFPAEYREIAIVLVDGDVTSRFEMFDEADLDAALARFDELTRPAHRLETPRR